MLMHSEQIAVSAQLLTSCALCGGAWLREEVMGEGERGWWLHRPASCMFTVRCAFNLVFSSRQA